MLDVANLRIDLGHRVLLNDASFRLLDGEKVALVGPNGAGKTTMLRILAGELHAAQGSVVRPEHFGWLQQDVQAKPEDAHRMSYDHLLSASPLTDMADQLKEWQSRIEKAGIDLGAGIDGADDALDKAVTKFTNLEERYRMLGGYQVEQRCRSKQSR